MSLAVLASGCKKVEIQPDAMTPDTDSVTFGWEEGRQTISFETNGDWTAALDDDADGWCSLSDDSGDKNNKEIVLHVEQNSTDRQRSCTLTLTSGSAVSEVSIVQTGRNDRMMILITHQETDFTALLFEGSDYYGTIEWGDGNNSSDISGGHSYSEQRTRVVTYDTYGVDSFTIPVIGDISTVSIYY